MFKEKNGLMMKDIYIIKKILDEHRLSDSAFCVWAALQPYSNVQMDLLLSVSYLGFLIFGREPTRTEEKTLKKGFHELIEHGHISVRQILKKGEYVCNVRNLYFEQGSEYFVVVTYDELHKIMNIQTKTNKEKLFRYFVSVVGCFNHSQNVDEEYRGKVCGISLENINALIPKKTAINYNEILEANELLYVYRSDDVLLFSNGMKRIANSYSRFEDKGLCVKFVMNYQNNYGRAHSKERRKSELDKANISRSLAQKYNNLVRGKQYDIETVREIYSWAVEWNQTQERIYEDELSKGYAAELRQKDMSVFKKFNFNKGEEYGN